MIYRADSLPHPLRLKADLCVVGSGPGGAAVAMVAAEAGLSVVVLEAGEFLTPADMVQREEEMLPRLYWESGGRTTTGREVHVHQGRGVGGSALHNLNLCKRIPKAIRDTWARERRLEHLSSREWDALYDEVELLLSVSSVAPTRMNRHNQLLEAGCKALGWAGGSVSHNRTGCMASGFCELGCAYDAKNNASKVLVPRAVAAGAEILACCQAVRVRHDGAVVQGVEALAINPTTGRPVGAVEVEAPRVCLAASATATPAILRRSRVPDPGGETGEHLHLHPALVAAGDFDEPVRAWEGIPQTYECTEHLRFDQDKGRAIWIVPAFAHPAGTAALLPGHGPAHREFMKRYDHLAVFTAMVHDTTAGRVRPDGDLGVSIEYWPNEADRRELLRGVAACIKLLFAAGARRVLLPTHPSRVFARGESFADVESIDLVPGLMDITSVHPMGSVPMGDIPTAAVSSEGRHHHLRGLFVADGSLFPSSIGVPPQLSIYALGLHVGRAVLRE